MWVPTLTGWMNDSEIVEWCAFTFPAPLRLALTPPVVSEREVWRAGVWTHTLRGDVVHNVAVGDFGNE